LKGEAFVSGVLKPSEMKPDSKIFHLTAGRTEISGLETPNLPLASSVTRDSKYRRTTQQTTHKKQTSKNKNILHLIPPF